MPLRLFQARFFLLREAMMAASEMPFNEEIVVRDETGKPVTRGVALKAGQMVGLEFSDKAISARISLV